MKKLFRSHLLLLVYIFAVPLKAQATFPGPSIAHWDLSVSDERNDADYSRIRKLVQEKKYDEAISILDGKSRKTPKESTPVILKALVLNEKGDYQEALDMLLESQKIEMRHPAAHFSFCQIYRNLGVRELSKRACYIAVEQHPNAPESHYELAQTLAAYGNMPTANAELFIAADLDPKNPVYFYERGMNYYYLNQYDESEKAFLKALSLDENHIDSLYQLAYLYAARKKPDLAKLRIIKILETRREDPSYNSAKLLLEFIEKGNMDKLPLKIIPHEYHVGRAKNLYQSRKYGLALIEIQTAAELKPEDIKIKEILIGLSSMLMRLDITEKAVSSMLQHSKDNNMLKARGYQELGDIRLIQGRLTEAKEFLNKALGLRDPDGLAKISLKEFPDEKAQPFPYNKNQHFFKPTDALNHKGEIFAFYKMYERAIAIYSMVIRMDPNHLLSLLNTATAYYNSGNHARTVSILERLLVTHPNHEFVLAHRLLLAKAYVKSDDLSGSLNHLELAVKMNPGIKSKIITDPVFEPLKTTAAFKNLVE